MFLRRPLSPLVTVDADPRPPPAPFLVDLVQRREETLPLLTQFLGDRDPNLRRQAAARLAHFGKDARDALPALRQLAEQDDDDVRNAAAGSLLDIQEALRGKRSSGG